MTGIRPAAVAGLFYPKDGAALRRQVEGFLAAASPSALPVKAIVAPHAGYVYSGPVAGSAYALLRPLAGHIRRVVLLGPAHRVAFRGIAVPEADALDTPLGPVAIDHAGRGEALGVGGVRPQDAAFAGEHSLEVHLPFLQTVLHDFTLVPLLVGHTAPEHVEAVLAALWGGPETLIVVSTDLSHFLPYPEAVQADGQTVAAVETLDAEKLRGDRACGFLPLAGLLRRARALDLRVTTLDVRNSGDTAGGRDRVVGYASFALEYAAAARLEDSLRAELLENARLALIEAAAGRRQPAPDPATFPPGLRTRRATFVTLEQGGQLRGCIGSLLPSDPLVVDVCTNTFRAAQQDPRFGPLRPEEVSGTSLSISILSHPRLMTFASEAELLDQLHPDVDGLIIRAGGQRALFLPKVWHDLPHPREFLRHLKAKAGLPPDRATPGMEAFRFTAEYIAAH